VTVETIKLQLRGFIDTMSDREDGEMTVTGIHRSHEWPLRR